MKTASDAEMSPPVTLPDIRISQVRLRTRDLTRLLGFYTDSLGLRLISRTGPNALLSATGAEPALLEITEQRQAPARPRGAAGLFHIAFLYPTRRDLALALLRVAKHGQRIEGASNHIVSEAIYLRDPDGNGIELYADRPSSAWVWKNGQVEMSTLALDLNDLLGTVDNPEATIPSDVPSATRIGHLHLQVTDLRQAEQFYHDLLGLDVTQREYPGALFYSAGRYHHHLATNTWGVSSPLPEGSAGLVSYRIEIPDKRALRGIVQQISERTPSSANIAGGGGGRLTLRDPAGVLLTIA